jgi:hypothetical protein
MSLPEQLQQSDRLDPLVRKITSVAMIGSFLSQLDATVVNVSRPTGHPGNPDKDQHVVLNAQKTVTAYAEVNATDRPGMPTYIRKVSRVTEMLQGKWTLQIPSTAHWRSDVTCSLRGHMERHEQALSLWLRESLPTRQGGPGASTWSVACYRQNRIRHGGQCRSCRAAQRFPPLLTLSNLLEALSWRAMESGASVD